MDKPTRNRRAPSIFTADVERKPKKAQSKQRRSSILKAAPPKQPPAPKKIKLSNEDKADAKYPEGEFDPIQKPEQVYSSEKISEEQIEKEKKRFDEAIMRVFERMDAAQKDELADIKKDFTSRVDDFVVKFDKPASEVQTYVIPIVEKSAAPTKPDVEPKPNAVSKPDLNLQTSRQSKPQPVPTKPSKMKFFHLVKENFIGKEGLVLMFTPLIHTETDDMRLCGAMFEKYPVIHGYLYNKYMTCTQVLFEFMVELLPNTTHPDLFYYTFYLMFPNYGPQKTFSEVFPKLVNVFAKDDADKERLLKLEHWKPPTPTSYEPNDPVNYSHPCSQGNYLVKTIKAPSGHPDDCCSEHCYNIFSNVKNELLCAGELIKIYIDKSRKTDVSFFNALLLDSKDYFVESFCQIAERFGSKTCSSWFNTVTAASVSVGDQLKIGSSKVNAVAKDRIFRNTMGKLTTQLKLVHIQALEQEAAENGEHVEKKILQRKAKDANVLNTKFRLTPCCHVGPCGAGVEMCSCDTMCSVFCQCDENCSRRFRGCRCQPNQCRTNSCSCVRLGWECMERTCVNCPNVANPDQPDFIGCKNKLLTYGVHKKVRIGPSTISGNGAFIDEDAKKGDFIGEYRGEYITEDETERRGKLYDLKMSYVFSLAAGCGSIDAGVAGSYNRFVNHASKPNCSTIVRMVDGKMCVGFVALKNITSGTELSIDYGYGSQTADMFFNIAPEDRVPKVALVPEPPVVVPQKKKTIYKRDPKLDRYCSEVIRKEAVTTKSGRISMRLSLCETSNKSSMQANDQTLASIRAPSTASLSAGAAPVFDDFKSLNGTRYGSGGPSKKKPKPELEAVFDDQPGTSTSNQRIEGGSSKTDLHPEAVFDDQPGTSTSNQEVDLLDLELVLSFD